MSNLYSNSIFFIDVDKIKPNPFQPRREFEERPLRDLSESIRQYGVLQPLTVSRVERETEDGGLSTEYELIAGERRLRASKLAGLLQVPVIIRVGDDNMMKLELAIIENLQREDLNAVERARAFMRLVEDFKFTHAQIGQKVGKSREYVSNTIRLLALPEDMLTALSEGKINEGHTRPLMMLASRPEEQQTLFKEITLRKISVREAERIARRIAVEKVRNRSTMPNPELMQIEQQLQETFGTRVHIEPREQGGKITIDYFSSEDLDSILGVLKEKGVDEPAQVAQQESTPVSTPAEVAQEQAEEVKTLDDRSADEVSKSEEDVDDLYNLKNFSL
jgi:ParB family transcriptional regulator, chromosome partitioning protein